MSEKRSTLDDVAGLDISADPKRFERRSSLGEGGMGKVDLAFDHLMKREVAVKHLHEGFADSDDLQRQFVREARLTGQLDHPNIVPVYELRPPSGEAAPSVVMKYVDGETYSQMIDRLHSDRTEEKLHEALQVFIKVCDAVSFAHERGVIHCDLKPDNIMVGKHGQVYVMDWGVAFTRGDRRRSSTDAPVEQAYLDTHQRRSSPLGGTLSFMAPEQLRGDQDAIDVTTDVYGLGGVLSALLVGKPPREPASDPSDWHETPTLEDQEGAAIAPPELYRIAGCALSLEQADRYPSVDALKHEIETFIAGGGWFATRRYLAGDVIVREGDQGSQAFIISDGECEVFRDDPGRARRIIRSMGPGDTFGELSLLTGMPRSATVVAKTDVSLRLITMDALDHELKRNPVLAAFMSAITSRFCDLEARLAGSDAESGS
jgi:serine/threonine-protein kinase